ncbi:tetratricopeptide repeat protein [Dactylosporangium matsuzakiense]|uniref:tetratricopeptide repeat protein n=1 Tax=Dactylosporangium matsuzakiense TaxID=53360 RepID=UPI0021FB1D38|nr:tetratricopeptide repeat protein [Dactylosporangium matsuzakiense]UWZ46558.1 tetratricopeptide repeat protein [Dactylosporangium matsuzakiense]
MLRSPAHRDQRTRAHTGLGHAHHTLGNPDRAREHYRHAPTLYTDLSLPEADQIRTRVTRLAASTTAAPNSGDGRLRIVLEGRFAVRQPLAWLHGRAGDGVEARPNRRRSPSRKVVPLLIGGLAPPDAIEAWGGRYLGVPSVASARPRSPCTWTGSLTISSPPTATIGPPPSSIVT